MTGSRLGNDVNKPTQAVQSTTAVIFASLCFLDFESLDSAWNRSLATLRHAMVTTRFNLFLSACLLSQRKPRDALSFSTLNLLLATPNL